MCSSDLGYASAWHSHAYLHRQARWFGLYMDEQPVLGTTLATCYIVSLEGFAARMHSLPDTLLERLSPRALARGERSAQLALLIDGWRASLYGAAVSVIMIAVFLLVQEVPNSVYRMALAAGIVLAVVARLALWPRVQLLKPRNAAVTTWGQVFIALAFIEGLCWAGFFGRYALGVDVVRPPLVFGLTMGLMGAAILFFGAIRWAWAAFCAPILIGQFMALPAMPVEYRSMLAAAWLCGVLLLYVLERTYARLVRTVKQRSSERDQLLSQQIALFESLSTGVALARSRHIVDCNRAFEEITGYTRAQLLGKSARMLLVSDEAFERTAAIHTRVSEGQAYRGIEQRRRADGRIIDVEVAMRAIDAGNADATVVITYNDITQQISSQRQLAEGQARMELAFSALDAGVWEEDLRTGKHTFSPQFKRIVGLEGGAPLTDFRLEAHLHHEDRDTTLWADQQQTLYGHPLSVVCRLRRVDGSYVWTHLQGVRGLDARGQPVRIVRTITDVTAQKEREQQVMRAYKEQKLIFDLAGEAIVFVSGANVDRCNAAFARMLGAPLERVIGSDIHEWIGLEIAWERVIAAAQEAAQRGDGNSSFELTLRTGNGDVLWAQLTARLTDLVRQQMICVFTDITERKRSEQQHAYDANHDSLTRLPNRRFLSQRLSAALADGRVHSRVVGVLLLDLDGFKAVNDTHGHAAGDSLLKQVAVRLTSVARESDTVARLGGDEFVVLATDVANAQHLRMVAEKIVRAVALPITLPNGEVTVHASVGVATFPFCGQDGSELLAAADAAMYRAKQAGKNRYVMAEPLPEQRAAHARTFAQEGNVIPLTREPNRSA
jgi:diguanylate cyclase (GGDEF)-like protein/PAS domain S-box-containing protein